VVELLHRTDQAEVSLLDEIRKGQAQVPVVLGDGDHELEVVFDEAVLDCAHALMGVFHYLAALQQGLFGKPRVRLQGAELARPTPAPPHLAGDAGDPLPEFGQQDEGKLSVEQIPADRVVETPLQAASEPLHGTLHPGGNLAGLFVSG
jgi:hypothetical protein